MIIDYEKIREEITHLLRNGDVLPISIRGVTTTTDNLTGSAGTTVTLTKTIIRNIRSFTINAVNKYLFRDYNVNWATGVITLNTALTGGETIVVNYDYGGSEKIYPDFPRDDLSLYSYPRIGIGLTSSSTQPLGLGGECFITNTVMTVYCWIPANKASDNANSYGGTDDLNELINAIRGVIMNNSKTFYSIPYIQPMSVVSMNKATNDKLIQMSVDFNIKFSVESTYVYVPPTPSTLLTGLLAYWKFEEAIGDFNSEVGSFNMVNAGCNYQTTGKVGYGIDFTGTSTTSVSNDIPMNTDMSFSFWSYANSFSAGGNAIMNKRSLGNVMQIFNAGGITGDFTWIFWNLSTSVASMGAGSMVTGVWEHWVVTYDGSNVRTYKDGTLLSTVPNTGTIGGPPMTTVFGDDGSGNAWNGKMDEFGIWSREITQTEVTELYNGGLGKTYPFL